MAGQPGPQRRTAVVTGGAGAIGAAICEALAAAGRAVAVADIDLAGADRVAERLRAGGAEAMALALDLTDPDAIAPALEAVSSQLGPAGILVNNAGWDEFKPFVQTGEPFWQKVMDINFMGALRITSAVLPAMIDAGWGRIVSVSSDAARVGSAQESVYAAAKGALISFSKSLARETARNGITVNAVCPGPIDTPLLRGLAQAGEHAQRIVAALQGAVPMRRLGLPEDVAPAVAFLASEETSFITGQTLSVSGGLTMA